MLHGHKSLYVSTVHSDWFSSQVAIIFFIYIQTFTEVVSFFVFFSYVVDEITNDSKRVFRRVFRRLHLLFNLKYSALWPLFFYDRMKSIWNIIYFDQGRMKPYVPTDIRVSLPSYQIKYVLITSLKPTIATDSLELTFIEALGILRFDTGSNATLKRRRRSRRLYYNILERYSKTRNVIKIIPEAAK